MQFGFLALDEIIQVSDQPVEPSFGSVAFTGTGCFAPVSWFAWYCHVVPTTVFLLVNDWSSFAASDQYSPMFAFCCFSRSTAALNWSSSSSYGSSISRSGGVAFRYSAASAM